MQAVSLSFSLFPHPQDSHWICFQNVASLSPMQSLFLLQTYVFHFTISMLISKISRAKKHRSQLHILVGSRLATPMSPKCLLQNGKS